MSLIKNCSIYFGSNVAKQSIPFLLLPILTRVLTLEEYGLVNIFMVLVNISGIFIGLSGHGAVGRAYYNLKKNELAVYTGTTFFIFGITFVLSLLIIGLFHSSISHLSDLPVQWLLCIPLIGLANYITLTNLVLWQVEEHPVTYGSYQFLQSLCNVALSVLLVIYFNLGWQGRLLGILSTTTAFAICSQWLLQRRKYLRWTWNSTYARSILRFGVPLIPHQLSSWVTTSLDRMIIVSMIGLEAAGVYAVAITCAQAITLLVDAFARAWSPYVFKMLSTSNSEKTRQRLVKQSYIYIISLSCIGLCYIVIVPILIPFIAGTSFDQAVLYLPPLIAAEIISGWYRAFAVYIFYEKKTELLSLVTLISGIIHIILLWVLVKQMGVIGAPFAYLCSSFITFIMTALLSNKIHPMPWFKLCL